jgi:hypothetical protein
MSNYIDEKKIRDQTMLIKHPRLKGMATARDFTYVRAGVTYKLRFVLGGWGRYWSVDGVWAYDDGMYMHETYASKRVHGYLKKYGSEKLLGGNEALDK